MRLRLCAAMMLASTACAPDDAPEAAAFSAASDGTLLGPDGRSMLLRGINARVDGIFDVAFDDGRTAVEVVPPFTAGDCGVLAELGLNLLRLPINWSAVEPARGSYDDAYLQAVVAVVDDCHEHGIFTLPDFHQDAYSKHIGEDGAPLWAIVPPPDELLEGPLEDLEARRTSPQVLRSFRSFFDDAEGIQTAFIAMAAHTAAVLDGTPGIVGLELFNEPVAFDDEALDAFHRATAAEIREVAPNLLLAFEPDALRNFNDTDPVTWPRPFTNALYAPHHYTDVFTDNWASGDVDALLASVAGIADEARRHEAHPFVGEFGNDLDAANGALWFEQALRAYDEHRVSWAMWLYEEWSQDAWGLYDFVEGANGPERSAFREAQADLIARPFPHAIAGRLSSIDWNPNGRVLTLAMSGDGTHTIGAPSRVWPTLPTATCDGAPATVEASGPGRVEIACVGSELVVAP